MAEPNREDEGNRGVENEAGSGEFADLRMPPEMMLDLARRAAELLVARTENLPEEGAWDGEFRRAVAKGMELAARAGKYVEKSRNLELLTPVSLGVVCFRVNPRARILGRSRVFFVHTLAWYVFTEAVHYQPQYDLGRRAGNPGYRRAVRDGDPVTSGYARGGPSQSLEMRQSDPVPTDPDEPAPS